MDKLEIESESNIVVLQQPVKGFKNKVLSGLINSISVMIRSCSSTVCVQNQQWVSMLLSISLIL